LSGLLRHDAFGDGVEELRRVRPQTLAGFEAGAQVFADWLDSYHCKRVISGCFSIIEEDNTFKMFLGRCQVVLSTSCFVNLFASLIKDHIRQRVSLLIPLKQLSSSNLLSSLAP
jgi:hypothetical protein